jgi:hypothetical protein
MTAHGGNDQERSPQDPADPEEEAAGQKNHGQGERDPAVPARGEGEEQVTAVELAAGDEVEGGDEQADPAGDENRMADGLSELRGSVVERGEEPGHEFEGERFAESDQGSSVSGRIGVREKQADGYSQERGKESGQRSVDANVDEGAAVWNAAADLDDSAGSTAQRGRRQHPGQRGADAMGAAGKVVSELMGEQDAEQGDGKRPSQMKAAGVGEQPGPGPKIVFADYGWLAVEEIEHEAGADCRGGDGAESEQKQGEAIVEESLAKCTDARPGQRQRGCERGEARPRRRNARLSQAEVPASRRSCKSKFCGGTNIAWTRLAFMAAC